MNVVIGYAPFDRTTFHIAAQAWKVAYVTSYNLHSRDAVSRFNLLFLHLLSVGRDCTASFPFGFSQNKSCEMCGKFVYDTVGRRGVFCVLAAMHRAVESSQCKQQVSF